MLRAGFRKIIPLLGFLFIMFFSYGVIGVTLFKDAYTNEWRSQVRNNNQIWIYAINNTSSAFFRNINEEDQKNFAFFLGANGDKINYIPEDVGEYFEGGGQSKYGLPCTINSMSFQNNFRDPSFSCENDRLEKYPPEDYRYSQANYNNLYHAMITLTQAFLGEAVHELMEGVQVAYAYTQDMDVELTWGAKWYIISWFILMTILFQSLLFGVLITVFSDLFQAQLDGKLLTEELEEHIDVIELGSNEASIEMTVDEFQSYGFDLDDLGSISLEEFDVTKLSYEYKSEDDWDVQDSDDGRSEDFYQKAAAIQDKKSK